MSSNSTPSSPSLEEEYNKLKRELARLKQQMFIQQNPLSNNSRGGGGSNGGLTLMPPSPSSTTDVVDNISNSRIVRRNSAGARIHHQRSYSSMESNDSPNNSFLNDFVDEFIMDDMMTSPSATKRSNNNNHNNNGTIADDYNEDDDDDDDDFGAMEKNQLGDNFSGVSSLVASSSSSLSSSTSQYGNVTEEQRRIKLENVINSFNKRGWSYLRTPTHPDDNNFTPVHVAFLTANENMGKFIICKCVEHEKWELLTGNSTSSKLALKHSPFDLALEIGHVDYVRDMVSWTRLQLQLLYNRQQQFRPRSRSNGSPMDSNRALGVNLSNLSSPDNSPQPVSKTPNAFVTSRTKSMRTISRDDNDLLSRSDTASSRSSGSNSSGGSRTARYSSRSYTMISNKNPLMKENENSDTSTDTIYEEFDHDQTIADSLESDMDELSDVELRENTNMNSSLNDVTSSGKDYAKFDENQYNLHQYDEVVHSAKIRNDPLFLASMSPRRVSVDHTHELTSVTEKSYLAGCKVMKKANLFKTGQYFTESLPVEEDEEKLLYSGLLENDDSLIPHHVKQCIKVMSEDFVVFEPHRPEERKQLDKSYMRRKLPEMLYEIDLKESAPKKRRAIIQSTQKQKNFFSSTPVEEIKVDPLSTDTQVSFNFIQQEYDADQRKDFIMDMMEDSYPVEEMKKNMNIDIEATDILLNDFVLKDENITSSTDLLFIPKGLKPKVFEYIGEPLEEILCSITIYDTEDNMEFTRITETFTFLITEKDVEKHKALFNLESVGDNMVALVRFSRRFKGEHTEALNELYLKGDKAKEKEVSAIKSKVSKYFDTMDNIYSFFAWSSFNVKSICNVSEPSTIPLNLLPNKPGNLPDKTLLQFFAHPETRRHKIIPGSVNLILKEIKISPVPRNFIAATGQLVLNLDGVHTPLSRVKSLGYIDTRILDIENTCIIHPSFLTLGSKKDIKNIQIVVSLRDNDMDAEESGLQAFYPLTTNSTSEMRTEGFTFVSQSNSTPDFTEEIKCQMPAKVLPNHHLLFKVYSVAHKDSFLQRGAAKTLVAYTYAYLLTNGQLYYGSSEMPLFAVKPGSRITNYFRGTDGKLEGAYLKVDIHAHSITHPIGCEGNLGTFFNLINRNPDYSTIAKEKLDVATANLASTPAHLNAYAPMIFAQLFQIIDQNSSVEAAETRFVAFRAIMHLVDKYRTENPVIVLAYVKYHFNHSNVCEALLKPMQMLFDQESEFEIILHNSWFIFAVLLKSIVLHLDLKMNKENIHDFSFSQSFYDQLSDLLVVHVGKFMRKMAEKETTVLTHMSSGIATFLMQLLSITNKGYVLQVAAKFAGVLSKLCKKEDSPSAAASVDMQLIFFKELFSYEHYLLLFLPQTVEEAMQITEDDTLLEENLSLNTHNHFIYSCFADTIIRCLYNPSRSIRMKGITFLREFVYRTNNDPRYQTLEYKQRINQVHFEFVNKFLDIIEEWKRVCNDKKKKLSSELATLRKKLITIKNNIQSKKLSLTDMKKHKTKSDAQQKVYSDISELERLRLQIETLIVKQEQDLKMEKPKVQEERRHLLLVILHILKNMNSEVLLKWFGYEGSDSPKQLALMDLFQNILVAFEFTGTTHLSAVYSALHKKKQPNAVSSPPPQRTRRKSGWGIDEWNDPDRVAQLNRQHKQAQKVSNSDNKHTDDKSKKNMLSFFKQPRSMSIFSFGTGSGEKTPTKQAKIEDTGPKISAPKKTAQSPTFADTESQRQAFVEVRVLREKHMSADSSFYILTLLMKLITYLEEQEAKNVHEDHLGEEKSALENSRALMEQVVRTIIYFLHLNQGELFLIALMSYLRSFFIQYGKALFSSTAELGTLFCESLMALCNSTVDTIREQAAATMYVLVRSSFMVNKGLAKPQIMMTVALSRTLQRTVPEDYYLLTSIKSFAELAKRDPDNPANSNSQIQSTRNQNLDEKKKPMVDFLSTLEGKLKVIDDKKMQNFTNDVQVLSEQLEKLLFDTISVNQTLTGKDIQKTEDLLYRISQFYERIPELRFLWLRQLANFHKQHGQHEEAVQCYYRIAAVVFNQLRNAKSPIIEGLPLNYFYGLSPYLLRMRNSGELSQGLLPHSAEFSEKGLITLLRTIVDALEQAEQYEHAIPILKILIPLFERSEDYANLSSTHGSIREMFELINTSVKENTRLYSTYYRLQFYGEAWGELNGKHYIYKMGKLFKLFKMKNKLLELFGSDIELITTPKKVDESKLEPGKRHLQFTNVKPLMDDDDDDDWDSIDSYDFLLHAQKRKRKTKFESNVNINKFYYETAFSKNAKKLSDKVTGIYKRKVILIVQNSFPDVKTRLPVVREQERILTPIESAIENIQAQIRKLEEVLEPNPPDIAQLQLVLQGSVRAGVNGGPKDIVTSFLSRSERFKYRREHVYKLNDKCQYFLFLCEQALKVDSKYARTNERAMHVELEKGFVETKNLFTEHLEPSAKAESMIAEYQQREQQKTASSANDPMKSETMEDVMQFNMNEYEMHDEDELDDLLHVPYNRNYRLSNKVEEKKLTLTDFLQTGKEEQNTDSECFTPI